MKNPKRMVIQKFLTEGCEAFRAILPRKCDESRPERGGPVSVSNHVMMIRNYKKNQHVRT